MKEKIKGKTLILDTLKLSDEPLSHSDIWEKAEKLGLTKLYAKGTDSEQKKRQIGSLLSTWTEKDDCPIIRHEKGYLGWTSITYELKNKVNNNSKVKSIHKIFEEIRNEKEDTSRPQINIVLRHKVWSNFWNNSMNGLCIVCGKPITITNFICGHIEAYSVNKNNDISNLAPICDECNKGMGTMDMREYKKLHYSNINIPCKIDIFIDYITKDDIIKVFESYIAISNRDSIYFEKAIEIIKRC